MCRMCGTTATTRNPKISPGHTPSGWMLSSRRRRLHASLAARDRTPHCAVLPLPAARLAERGPRHNGDYEEPED